MQKTYSFIKNETVRDAAFAVCIAVLVSSTVLFTTQAYAEGVTLSVDVQTALTFTLSSNNFSTITPGTPVFATSTLAVATNNANGYNIVLSGDNKNSSNHNLQRTGETSVQITDQTEWVAGAATTSAGNAVRIGSFANSGDVLAMRVLTASSTNGTAFLAPTWWGAVDSYSDNASTLWAGISSSTVSRQIGNAGAGSYGAVTHINSVAYYLDVASTQKTGTYTAPITYTATAN